MALIQAAIVFHRRGDHFDTIADLTKAELCRLIERMAEQLDNYTELIGRTLK